MTANRWHVYEKMKRHWRKTGKIMDRKEVVSAFPGIAFKELVEGTAEFVIAHERSFSKEASQDKQHEAEIAMRLGI